MYPAEIGHFRPKVFYIRDNGSLGRERFRRKFYNIEVYTTMEQILRIIEKRRNILNWVIAISSLSAIVFFATALILWFKL